MTDPIETMCEVVVGTRSGAERRLTFEPGATLMEVIRDSGIDELLALCGGCCACATCHVYIDEGFAGGLSPMSQDEADLLESSDHRIPSSRLSCQLQLAADLAGLRVTIAPED